MYERRGAPLLSQAKYLRRLGGHFALAMLLVALSLGAGMYGYWYFEGLHWRDGFMNAAMLLAGMGPVHTPLTPGGKVFAGCYALYAGLVFLVVVGIVFAPLVHRLLHRFHWEGGQST